MPPHSNPPPPSVLSAFRLTHLSAPTPLAGGQGESFIVKPVSPSGAAVSDTLHNAVVLKPTLNIPETEFISHLQSQLVHIANPAYRIASPIPVFSDHQPPHYVYNGWTATSFLPGIASSQIRIGDVLPASRAMHADIARLVPSAPACVRERVDRWAWADRVVWGEVRAEDVPDLDAQMYKELCGWVLRLEACRRPLHEHEESENGSRNQLIHGDLSGNVLFGDEGTDMAPATIDFSPQWHPVAYAEAVMVADGITWQGEGEEMVRVVGFDWFRMQMLVRALMFRVVTYCIQVDREFVLANLPNVDVEGAVGLVERLVKEIEGEGER